jgi:hypothetical protein
MKRKPRIGELLELAKRDQSLNLGSKGPELEPIVAYFECIVDKRANGISLSEDDQDFLVEIGLNHVLTARRGHPELLGSDLQRAKRCVAMLMEIGKQVHGIVSPARTPAPLLRRIAARAIELVEQRLPALRGLVEPPRGKRLIGERSDIRNYNPKLTQVVIDYVNQQFPEARAQMRDLPAPSRRRP